jgi:hypothetical protein
VIEIQSGDPGLADITLHAALIARFITECLAEFMKSTCTIIFFSCSLRYVRLVELYLFMEIYSPGRILRLPVLTFPYPVIRDTMHGVSPWPQTVRARSVRRDNCVYYLHDIEICK